MSIRRQALALVSWVLFEGELAGSVPRWPLRGREKGSWGLVAQYRRAKRSLNVRNPLLVRQAQWQWRSTREGRGAGREREGA